MKQVSTILLDLMSQMESKASWYQGELQAKAAWILREYPMVHVFVDEKVDINEKYNEFLEASANCRLSRVNFQPEVRIVCSNGLENNFDKIFFPS